MGFGTKRQIFLEMSSGQVRLWGFPARPPGFPCRAERGPTPEAAWCVTPAHRRRAIPFPKKDVIERPATAPPAHITHQVIYIEHTDTYQIIYNSNYLSFCMHALQPGHFPRFTLIPNSTLAAVGSGLLFKEVTPPPRGVLWSSRGPDAWADWPPQPPGGAGS